MCIPRQTIAMHWQQMVLSFRLTIVPTIETYGQLQLAMMIAAASSQ